MVSLHEGATGRKHRELSPLTRRVEVCAAAGDGVDAQDKMKEHKIDAIITDIGFPEWTESS